MPPTIYWLGYRLGLTVSLLAGWFSINRPAFAQIIPDNTLPTNSQVAPGCTVCTIDGGTQVGGNLFHSFSQFSIPTGGTAFFNNNLTIQNILTRVTGGIPSQIDGLIQANGSANLFLLNPSGIHFGANASLNLGGSFFASTADSFRFADGSEFSASNPQAPPLLTVNVPIGPQFNSSRSVAPLTNRATLMVPGDLTLAAGNLDLQGQVWAGGTLTLTAQNTLTIRDGTSQPFRAVAGGNLLVQGNSVDIFALNHPNSGFWAGGDLTLRSPNPTIGDAHFSSGGNVRIERQDGTPGDLISPNDPVIRASGNVTFTSYTGASLHIFAGGSVTANSITITNPDLVNGLIETVTLSDSSTVAINGSTQPVLDIRAGTTAFNPVGSIPAAPAGFTPTPPGTGGTGTSTDITIGTTTIQQPNGLVFLTNQYQSNTLAGSITLGTLTNTNPTGGGGNLIIDSRGNIIVNGTVSVSAGNPSGTFQGDGGTATLLSAQEIRFNSGSVFLSNGLLGGTLTLQAGTNVVVDDTGIISDSFTNVVGGQGGNVTITTASLAVTNGAQLSTSTFGNSDAGSVTIIARDQVVFADDSRVFSRLESGAEGSGGTITITTGSLALFNGAQLLTNTLGKGNAGNVIIAADQVRFDGVGNGGLSSAVISSVASGAEGNGGRVEITTGSLTVTNGAQLVVGTFGKGDAGSIMITTNQARFDGVGSNGLSSNAISGVETGAEGNGGAITITTGSLAVTNGARLTAITSGKGNAGNITITARDQVAFDNSVALSRVGFGAEGNGGRIDITTDSLTIANSAQINASSSGVGNGGTIAITANDISLDGATGTNFANIQTQLLPGAIGNAGRIDITTGTLSVINGAVLTASTAGQGNAGSIAIRARDAVRLDGVNNNGLPSRFVVGVNFPAVGNGGRLDIAAKSVTVANGAFLSAGSGGGLGNGGTIGIQADDSVTFDRGDVRLAIASGAIGNGGTLDITAPTITLANGSVFDADTVGLGNAGAVRFQANQVVGDRSAITTSVASGGVGNGGTIGIQAATIDFSNTVLFANTAGQGDAGDIALQASQSILLDNTSVVDSSVLLDAVGNGGTIAVTTDLLTINNQSLLSAFSGGQGAAGDIQVQATNLRINNGGSIATISLTGNGGNISLNIADSIILRNNSDITVTALGDGDGGRISITAGGFILALLNEDSDIFANAVTGSGGRIFAQATGIYGFRLYQGVNTPESDFFADSRSGVNGIVEIQTPPGPGLNSQALPVLDPTNQIAQNCRPAGETGRFVVTGRGGLPPSPAEIVVGGSTLWEDVENQTSGATIPQAATPLSLTPAQGWVVNDRGDVTLVATMPSSYCDRR